MRIGRSDGVGKGAREKESWGNRERERETKTESLREVDRKIDILIERSA